MLTEIQVSVLYGGMCAGSQSAMHIAALHSIVVKLSMILLCDVNVPYSLPLYSTSSSAVWLLHCLLCSLHPYIIWTDNSPASALMDCACRFARAGVGSCITGELGQKGGRSG